MKAIVTQDSFNYESVAKVSSCAAQLCNWVTNIYYYHEVSKKSKLIQAAIEKKEPSSPTEEHKEETKTEKKSVKSPVRATKKVPETKELSYF